MPLINLFACSKFLLGHSPGTDDVFYEDLKKVLEECFEIYDDDIPWHTSHDYVEIHNIHRVLRLLL